MAREPERIVIGIDFSAAGEAALRRVETLCPKGGPVRIDLVYVIAPLAIPRGFGPADIGYEQVQAREAEAALALVMARLRRRLGPRARISAHVLRGSPGEALRGRDSARGTLIVVGRHGQTGIQRQALVGSVADRVVRFAPCAVLVVPHPVRPSSSRKLQRRRTQRLA
jgi:nucleotide-binding universal stress UspA family protein